MVCTVTKSKTVLPLLTTVDNLEKINVFSSIIVNNGNIVDINIIPNQEQFV
jgi:hypothetical protein